MFLIAERPHLFPGRCLLGDTRGPCVDTGVEMELGGHVYLNRLEAWEAGRLFGFVESETHQALQAERDQIAAELEAALERIGELEVERDAYARVVTVHAATATQATQATATAAETR